jgi:hypothetical protein
MRGRAMSRNVAANDPAPRPRPSPRKREEGALTPERSPL